jgi:hypothetical protein
MLLSQNLKGIQHLKGAEMKRILFIMLIALIFGAMLFFSCKKNRPPNPPGSPSGPSTGYKDSIYTFTTITNDPDNDGVCYRFDWNDGDTSDWNDWVQGNYPVTFSHSWSQIGTYKIQAQAKDANDAISSWSNPHQINVVTILPNTPATPSGPSSGGINISYEFSSSSTDMDNDSVAIRFDWGDGDTSSWSSFVPSGAIVIMSYSWTSFGDYFVRAQAKDKDNSISSWASGHLITIKNYSPDEPSTPSGPSRGDLNITYYFTSISTDPDGDSIAIRFDWDDGDTSDWSHYVPSGQIISMSHSYSISGYYYLKAKAKDKYGATSNWSSGHLIIIGNPNPPNTPSILSGPSNGYSDTVYSFVSSTTDPDGDSIAIRFDWDDGDTSDWSHYVPSGDRVTISHSWQNPNTYYLKTQAKDVWGDTSSWSSGYQILIEKPWHCATTSAGWSERSGHTSVVFDNKMWVLGGTNGSNSKNDVWFSTDGVNWTRATVYAGWSERYGHTSVVFDNKMWVIGGSYRNDVWYSTDGVNWTCATSFAVWSGRLFHTSVVFDNKIWLLGGVDNNIDYNDVWYSSNGVIWTQATDSAGWSERSGHTSVVFDNKMWVLGGDDGNDRNDVWYSSDGVNWTMATANAGWSERYGHTSVVFDNKMWVLGGLAGSEINDVWYSSDGINWTQATYNAGWSERNGHTSVVFDNKMWVLGGFWGSYHNDVWYWP